MATIDDEIEPEEQKDNVGDRDLDSEDQLWIESKYVTYGTTIIGSVVIITAIILGMFLLSFFTAIFMGSTAVFIDPVDRISKYGSFISGSASVILALLTAGTLILTRNQVEAAQEQVEISRNQVDATLSQIQQQQLQFTHRQRDDWYGQLLEALYEAINLRAEYYDKNKLSFDRFKEFRELFANEMENVSLLKQNPPTKIRSELYRELRSMVEEWNSQKGDLNNDTALSS
jgi:signal transduction histidine kinase